MNDSRASVSALTAQNRDAPRSRILSFRTGLKRTGNALSLAMVAAPAAMCWLEKRLHQEGEAVFNFWTHIFAILPGFVGLYLRRGFYRLTLDRCAPDFFVGFGAIFTHRHAVVAPGVYVGPYALVGSCHLGEGALIGSRVSILSGSSLHEMDATGRWTPYDIARLQQMEVGAHCWIGEAAVIMASVGPRAMVAAGTVVSSAVPPAVVVAGNPARFVRRVEPGERSE